MYSDPITPFTPTKKPRRGGALASDHKAAANVLRRGRYHGLVLDLVDIERLRRDTDRRTGEVTIAVIDPGKLDIRVVRNPLYCVHQRIVFCAAYHKISVVVISLAETKSKTGIEGANAAADELVTVDGVCCSQHVAPSKSIDKIDLQGRRLMESGERRQREQRE